MELETLNAWRPYKVALKCFYKLHNLSSPGAFDDWDVYWLSAITSTRAVWHCLQNELDDTELAKDILRDYNNGPAKWEIHQEFTRDQRNNTLKDWAWDIVPDEVSCYSFLGGEFHGNFIDLVFNYTRQSGEPCSVNENLQGEDPLRLLGISLRFLHRELSVIEISLQKNIKDPFSTLASDDLYSKSKFFDHAPNFYR